MIALFLSTAQAQYIAKTGDICVTASARWTELAGDNWILEGAVDRPARGFQYTIVDAVNTYTGNLGDSDGCLHDFPVLVAPGDPTIRLEITSKAVVNGVSMVSWEGPHTQSKQFLTVVWPPISTGTGTTFSGTKNIASQDQRWLNLLVGTMVFRLYDYNVNQGNSRDCCLEGSLALPDEYNLDGTCGVSAPSGAAYARITTPIQLQANPNGVCCGSTIEDNDGNSQDPPGVQTSLGMHRKYTIAHEFGHVIGEMRMGAKEWGEYTLTAYDDDCNGNYDEGVLLTDEGDRGEFRKLTLSWVLREAWGNFVAVMTWNDRYEDDCAYQHRKNQHDFDLDGVVDNDRADDHFDGAYDCEGIPTLPGDPPIASYVTARNWLEDLEDADDDDQDQLQCVRDTDDIAESYHRSTVYDVTRFLWDLTTDQLVHPDDLSDIYVDMCPRGWFNNLYPSTSTQLDLPMNRLLLSADHHGFSDEVLDEITHLLH